MGDETSPARLVETAKTVGSKTLKREAGGYPINAVPGLGGVERLKRSESTGEKCIDAFFQREHLF